MYTTQTFHDNFLKLEDIMENIPTGCIFLDQYSEITNINNAASKILKVKYLGHYTRLKLKLELYPDFHPIMLDLLNGKIVKDVRLSLKCMDNNFVPVILKASLISGTENVFIFQFTKIKSFAMVEYLLKLSNYVRTIVLMMKLQCRKLFKLSEKKVFME